MSSKSSNTSSSEEDNNSSNNELRRGPWTLEEDTLLIRYIAQNSEGRWNLLAKRSGLRRTGKSCRLRWLNYLKPDVKRGNLTPEEQLMILDLHSKWGNRWSKIAQYLPGRTDNEIKNYWRTRVQKQAKHLKIDTESAAFQDIIRRFWMPMLIQKIQGSSPPALGLPIAQKPIIVNNSQSQNCPENPMNMSHTSHLSESPNFPFHQQIVYDHNNNTTNDNDSTFLEDLFCGIGESHGCGMDMLSHTQTSASQPKGLANHTEDCHMLGGDCGDSDIFGTVWTMDELWQQMS